MSEQERAKITVGAQEKEQRMMGWTDEANMTLKLGKFYSGFFPYGVVT